jgi:hypothetical protein
MDGVVLVSCMVISEMHTIFLLGNPVGRYHVENVSVHGTIVRRNIPDINEIGTQYHHTTAT